MGGFTKEHRIYHRLFRDCRAVLHSKESFEGCPYRDIPKAVHVPMNLAGIIPAGTFVAVPRLRHVSIEAGISAIGAEAWQCCRNLRVFFARVEALGWPSQPEKR